MISAHVNPPFPPDPSQPDGLLPATPVFLTGLGVRSKTEQRLDREGGEQGQEGALEQTDSYNREGGAAPVEVVEKGSAWTLADIMTTPVVTARCGQSLREVVQVLAERGIAGVPVVDETGEVAGVVSQADIAAHVAHSWAEVTPEHDPGRFYQSLWIRDTDAHERMSAETPVEQVMAPYVYYATADATLDEAADVLLQHNIHRIIVLEGKTIVGIVSSLDLLRAYRARS